MLRCGVAAREWKASMPRGFFHIAKNDLPKRGYTRGGANRRTFPYPACVGPQQGLNPPSHYVVENVPPRTSGVPTDEHQRLQAASDPKLLGFPFFYWYQLVWVPVTVIVMWIVYRSMPHDD